MYGVSATLCYCISLEDRPSILTLVSSKHPRAITTCKSQHNISSQKVESKGNTVAMPYPPLYLPDWRIKPIHKLGHSDHAIRCKLIWRNYNHHRVVELHQGLRVLIRTTSLDILWKMQRSRSEIKSSNPDLCRERVLTIRNNGKFTPTTNSKRAG